MINRFLSTVRFLPSVLVYFVSSTVNHPTITEDTRDRTNKIRSDWDKQGNDRGEKSRPEAVVG